MNKALILRKILNNNSPIMPMTKKLIEPCKISYFFISLCGYPRITSKREVPQSFSSFTSSGSVKYTEKVRISDQKFSPLILFPEVDIDIIDDALAACALSRRVVSWRTSPLRFFGPGHQPIFDSVRALEVIGLWYLPTPPKVCVSLNDAHCKIAHGLLRSTYY